MKTIINSIFQEKNFIQYELSIGNLFTYPPESGKISYWLVVENNDFNILNNQNDFFDECKKSLNTGELDKNSSLIILSKVEEDVDLKNLKDKILQIEEDPFQFKKFVLYYSENELSAIQEEIRSNGLSPLKFIEGQIVNSECFSKYKEDPKLFIWQSLVYRISHKLPFVDIKVQQDNGLQSLFDTNKAKIVSKGFSELDTLIEEAFLDLSDEDFTDLSSEDMLQKLTKSQENEN
ncbi:ABC-three component system middle component 1 [Flavobacterium adhaerens]|uniref:ABC-three component system middle component 1 n=1 Tax=Flavobacterium adhaerens TaxID=3149043 RepID=UPI0032B45288